MKMKCAHCGGVISSKCNYCNLCGESTRKQRSKRRMIMIGGIAAVLIACVILHGNYLMPWQIPLYKDRKAIIQYVRENHPDSKIVEEHIKYKLEGSYFVITGATPDCHIKFEENGFQYIVDYNNKNKSIIDYYKKSKLANDVRVFINEEFFKSRGIENVDVYCDFGFKSPNELPDEWSEYNDSYTVQLVIRNQGSTPYEVGWMYNFYNFWKENMIFSPSWYIEFIILDDGDNPDGFLYVSYESNIVNAADMYKGFI